MSHAHALRQPIMSSRPPIRSFICGHALNTGAGALQAQVKQLTPKKAARPGSDPAGQEQQAFPACFSALLVSSLTATICGTPIGSLDRLQSSLSTPRGYGKFFCVELIQSTGEMVRWERTA
jgi:hypothetical protein